jgi:4-carboxymuconolactone decarboxylase
MITIKKLSTYTLFLCGICFSLNAQQSSDTTQALNAKEQCVVLISAFTAKGDLPKLHSALVDGLNAGLTINEIKEVLVQLYAYTGFPRSLNALQTFMDVLKTRKQNGIIDKLGSAPTPIGDNRNKLQVGTDNQTRLVGQPIKGELYEFSPTIDVFLKEHLFADIFGRDNLDWKTRELVTIAALAALGGVENQLRSHFRVGMHNGLTERQLEHLVAFVASNIGTAEGDAADRVLSMVLQRGDKLTADSVNRTGMTHQITLFPKGEKITNQNFTGDAWLQIMVTADSMNTVQVGSVTFDPGARTNWHFHPGGQILMIIEGTGYYQEQGKLKRLIRKGEVVECPPNTSHWHGASKYEKMIHVAITNTNKGVVIWQQPVTDEEYRKQPN